ncbi:MAG: phasin family protein [Azonexus sp.]|nr:phasin family protein [Azonexus sp.]
MIVKPEEFAKSSFNFALFFANTAFEGVERLTVLNLTAARSMMEAGISNLNALIGVKDIQSFVELQKGMAAPSLEKGVEYSRNVIAIATEAKEKISKEVEVQVADTHAKVSGMVEKALAAAPAGSEVAVAAVKTAIKSANDAIDGLNKVAKQAAEVAEASVAAATEATIKAANVAAPKAVAKKAA